MITRLMSVVFVTTSSLQLMGQEPRQLILPEQRCIQVRDPERLPPSPIPDVSPPETVTGPQPGRQELSLSLDQAIHIALQNAQVIRVVAGTDVVTSGETIYEPAITNTSIDQNRARFDPVFQSQNTALRVNEPLGSFIFPPLGFGIIGQPLQTITSSTGVSKTFLTGGQFSVTEDIDYAFAESNFFQAANLLNPQTANHLTLSVSQPLLQGAGAAANMAPILVARINTEESFFRLKDSVQDLVLSVIESYWNLSYSRVAAWASGQQVRQGWEALERAEGRMAAGLGDEGEVAQARVSYGNFRAAQVTAEANVLTQEALLRNLLGIPQVERVRINLTSAPGVDQKITNWQNILRLAGCYRPDIIELKLVLEADQQNLIVAQNQSLPQLNASARYRWNGLEGTSPFGPHLSSEGEFGDWQVGVNFSVPLGLRKERAGVRQQEFLTVRDRANLQQAMHGAAYKLASNVRNLDQYYEQYQLYKRTREAAMVNVERQMADYLAGRRTLYINVLLAINDWGNAVNNEYQALVQYNSELARLERQTGTILETHSVRFCEERERMVGPLGRFCDGAYYPRDMQPVHGAMPAPMADVRTYQRPEAPPNVEGSGDDNRPSNGNGPLPPSPVPTQPENIPPPPSRPAPPRNGPPAF
jgi:outer membrane protein TolC